MENQSPRFSVSDFIALTNQTLEYAYTSVQIEGEVSSFKVNQGKYVFFDLKDETGTVGCFMMVFQLRIPIEDGMKVIVRATPKLTNWGKFSLTVSLIRPSGEGGLKKSFELLKAKLETEGLFAKERKRSLPTMPSHIAVISSTQAAGYGDFIKIINQRWTGMTVNVAHVQVQGDVAADQIIRALKYFNQLESLPEVVVLIRGGGSADDLAVFNDEPLVREIAASRVPVLTGIGHEVDISLADLAADVRASTPSNAAELLVPDKADMMRSIDQQLRFTLGRTEVAIKSLEETIDGRLLHALESINTAVDEHARHLDHSKEMIALLNPYTILERGYAMIKGEVQLGAVIEIETSRQIITAEVQNVTKK